MAATAPSTPSQLMFPGQAAAPDGPIDLAGMYLMHRCFRRDLELFAEAVPAFAVNDRARWQRLVTRFGLFASVLHKHHHGEDIGLWPLLAERGADGAVLDQLEAEHAVIDPLLASCTADLAAMADGTGDAATRARLAATTARLREALVAHLGHEERDGMALVQQHLTPEDWTRLDKEVFSKEYRPRDIPAVLGWLTPGLTDEEALRMPGANRLFLPFARWMARRFERRETRLFGAPA
jgi:hemerythrin-like domain-containing protein